MSNQRWQYQTLTGKVKGTLNPTLDEDEFLKQLNEQGARGWELVCAMPHVALKWGGAKHVWLLKRAG